MTAVPLREQNRLLVTLYKQRDEALEKVQRWRDYCSFTGRRLPMDDVQASRVRMQTSDLVSFKPPGRWAAAGLRGYDLQQSGRVKTSGDERHNVSLI